MNRIHLFIPILIVVWIAGVARAQTPPAEPRIEYSASTGADGAVTVSGKVVLPPGWKLSIHTLTIRYQKAGGSATLNALLPLKAPEFKGTINLTAGSYQTWAVIDVKDADGREKQISSQTQSVTVN